MGFYSNISPSKKMAKLKGQVLNVKSKNMKKDVKNIKSIRLKKGLDESSFISVEDIYFNSKIASSIPNCYTVSDRKLVKRLYKCVANRVCSSREMTINEKSKILKSFNWENFRGAVLNTVDAVRSYKIDKKIICADITRAPIDSLFYNYKINTKDSDSTQVIKMFKNIETFKTGDLKIGYQEGSRDENGNVVFSSFEPSKASPDKCYFTLSFMEDYKPSQNEKKETVIIYYYLGNSMME